jgi:hypothetical protein
MREVEADDPTDDQQDRRDPYEGGGITEHIMPTVAVPTAPIPGHTA